MWFDCQVPMVRSNIVFSATFYSLTKSKNTYCVIILWLFPVQTQTYEIILTLGQAFEVAYQMALQAQESRRHSSYAGPASENIEPKTNRPTSQSRNSMQRSTVSMTSAHDIWYHSIMNILCSHIFDWLPQKTVFTVLHLQWMSIGFKSRNVQLLYFLKQNYSDSVQNCVLFEF